MSIIYERYTKAIKNNPNQVFVYDFDNSYTGRYCYEKLKQTENFLKYKNIKKVGIQGVNNFDWIILYLAAQKNCNQTFLIKNSFDTNLTQKIKKKYKLDFILKKIPDKKIKKSRKIFSKYESKKDILFTSGTTNFPKGVVIDEHSYIHVAKFLVQKFRQKNNDLEILSMPFDHSFGLVRLRCCLYTGTKIFVSDGLSKFPEIYKFTKNNKVTGLSLVPSGIELIKLMLKNKTQSFTKNLKYFEIGSSFLDRKTRIWLKNNFKNTTIFHHYGMTEASRSFLIPRGKNDDLKKESNVIGEKIYKCYFKLDPINKNLLKGELLLKGINLMDGYLETKDNNIKFTNQWFRTGDICELKRGKLRLLGRTDNQINIGGNKIQAESIENLIEKIHEVEKCLCYELKDHFFNKRIGLTIDLNKKIKKEIIKKKILKVMQVFPSYCSPKKILFKKILLTENGKKIRKRVL
tara:strand:+ start:6692 stop:8074 length:1383 start_codon:yes stop_codon:yes gene_type:complete